MGAGVALVPVIAAAGQASAPAPSAAAAASFDPGLIVSDDAFYDDAAMTEDGVQSFLERMPCRPQDGSPCLADYRQDTTTQPADPGHCDRYRGARGEPASRIVAKVARACGISPRVLLVLVQKEQSLVTRPSASGYERAAGYGCPDTADCDARYFGLFNQLYNAAWQFREYTLDAEGWRYRVGDAEIAFSPRADCGAAVVRIRNQATANLYNYTPYQPSAAALAHPDEPGDACASHGNLNFSRLYADWFGDPTRVRFGDEWPACLSSPGGVRCPDSVWSGLDMPRPEYPGD